MTRVTDREFNAALPVMQKLLWGHQQDRERLQALGINLIPVNFYSNTPSIAETLSAYEYTESTPPYLNRISPSSSIAFRVSAVTS